MRALVSIILPIYNVEKYISKNIESVLNQTYINFELLVINDGATDNSARVAEQFKDSRIKIFHKKNEGVSIARNFGLQKASGKYLYFLDSDDWIEPDLLEKCIQAIEHHKSFFVIFGYNLDTEDLTGNLISSKKIIHNEIIFERKKKNLFFEKETLGLLGYVWNKFYLTSFIRELQLEFNPKISLFEDVLFNTNIYGVVDKIIFIDEILYHYIDRPRTSLVKKFHQNSFDLTIKVNNGINRFLTVWQMDSNLKNKVLADNIIVGVRYSVNALFAYENDLNFFQKLHFLKQILNHKETKKSIIYYQPESLSDKIYKGLIFYRAGLSLYLLCKIIK